MANEKTIWENILSIVLGALGTVGVAEAMKGISQHVQVAATRKAKDFMTDSGERTGILVDIAKLMDSKEPGAAAAGEKVRKWFIQAHEDHLEGKLTNLFRKFSSGRANERMMVFRVLGGLDTYEDFMATVMAILDHDNLLQVMLETADRAKDTGGNILSDDAHKLRELARTSLSKFAGSTNDAARALTPRIQNITDSLRRFRERRARNACCPRRVHR
jgi:hypothetical protein